HDHSQSHDLHASVSIVTLPWLVTSSSLSNAAATTDTYTLSLHDALPIWQMHEIKKVLSDKLMSLGRDELANYADYYYSINHRQWYLVTHKDGLYRTNEISRPPSL